MGGEGYAAGADAAAPADRSLIVSLSDCIVISPALC